MYGENGEVEYGGDMKNAYRPDRSVEDQLKHYFSSIPPEYWEKHKISKHDLKPFTPPPLDKIKKIKQKYISSVITNTGIHKKIFIMPKNIVILTLIPRGMREPFQNMQV